MDEIDPTITLDQLQPGERAVVTKLVNTGLNRRRMMDLGILPGTQIEIEMKSPLGDPIAYRVRGAIVALRREQTREIHIAPETDRDNNQEKHHDNNSS